MSLRYIEIFVKRALSKSLLEATDYALNPYRGCEHQCIYCYSPFVTHMPIDEWRSVVYVKRNLPTALNIELKKMKKRGFITIGTVTDAYQPAEKKYEITRKSLYVLLKYDARISILTKSSLILRDIDILEKFKEVHVGITITTLDDDMRRKIEPGSSSVDSRLSVIEEFEGRTITYMFVGPIFQGIGDADIEEYFRIARRHKLNYIIFDRFRFKRGMVIPDFLRSRDLSDAYYSSLREKIMKIAKNYETPTHIEW